MKILVIDQVQATYNTVINGCSDLYLLSIRYTEREEMRLLLLRIQNEKKVYLLDIKHEDTKTGGPQSFLHYVKLLFLLQIL